MRDDFSSAVKRQLAARVAWRCSYPGCRAVTIGPKGNEEEGSINLGEAAHIHAASPLGPRYDEAMSTEDRSAISNGIWMCRHHARLIDADKSAYTAETLITWKALAEANAHSALINGSSSAHIETTLVLINNSVVVEAIWIGVSEKTWVFEILSFLEGSVEGLRQIVSSPVDEGALPHFLVVETQGDGRVLYPGSALNATKEGRLQLHAQVAPSAARITLAELGSDLAIGEDGDLVLEDGDIKMVSGTDLLRQQLTDVLSAQMGDYKMTPLLSSDFTRYYLKYKGTPLLLSRFLRLELARLAAIPLTFTHGQLDGPTLNVIRRVEKVEVIDETEQGHVMIGARLILEHNTSWEGRFRVYIRDESEE